MPESPLPAVSVTLGTQKTVQAVLTENNALLLEKSRAGSLTQSLSLPDRVEAPVSAGEPLGSLDVFDTEGTLVSSLPLLAGEDVPRVTWRQLFRRCVETAFCAR